MLAAMRARALIFVLVASAAVDASGAPAAARGTFCGSSRCVVLSKSLATVLSQRNDTYSTASAPKPAPFYRITITGTGEGFITRTILWVPTVGLWDLKEYVTPSIGAYWRTANTATTPALEKLAAGLKPFPAPKRWPPPGSSSTQWGLPQ